MKRLFIVDVTVKYDSLAYLKVADNAEEAMNMVRNDLDESGEAYYGIFPREIKDVDGYEIVLRGPFVPDSYEELMNG